MAAAHVPLHLRPLVPSPQSADALAAPRLDVTTLVLLRGYQVPAHNHSDLLLHGFPALPLHGELQLQGRKKAIADKEFEALTAAQREMRSKTLI